MGKRDYNKGCEEKDEVFALIGLNVEDLCDLGEGIDHEEEPEKFFEERKEDEELKRILKRGGGNEVEEELQSIYEGGIKAKNSRIEEEEIENLIEGINRLD